MTVYKTRKLPIAGKIYVKVDDEIKFDTIIARTYVKGDPEIVKVAAILGFNSRPEDIQIYMKKEIGEKVSKGERFAGYSTFFGLFKKWAESPVDGVIESMSTTTGHVVIRGSDVPVDIDAYIPGKVIEVLPDGAIISTNAVFIQGIFGIGGEIHGKLKMAVDRPDEELTVDHITAEDKGKLLIGGSFMTLEAIRKAIDVEVAGCVAGGISYHTITNLIGEELGVAITGHEEIGITLIATEGFGKLNMSQRTFDIFKSFEGYSTCSNGTTQIRAGVIRPEIIIPHEISFDRKSEDILVTGMVPGTPIRIIREPYFGFLGVVHSLPVKLQLLDSGSHVRVLEVELNDSQIVTVPRANVEIIEE